MMEKEEIFEEFCVMCYIKKIKEEKFVPQFAIRERFFTPKNLLTGEDILAINNYLNKHSQNLDTLFGGQHFGKFCSCYAFTQCEGNYSVENKSPRNNFPHNFQKAKENIDSWLIANNPKGNLPIFTRAVGLFTTKQDVFNEIESLMKIEYEYASKLECAKKLNFNKNKIKQNFAWEEEQEKSQEK